MSAKDAKKALRTIQKATSGGKLLKGLGVAHIQALPSLKGNEILILCSPDLHAALEAEIDADGGKLDKVK